MDFFESSSSGVFGNGLSKIGDVFEDDVVLFVFVDDVDIDPEREEEVVEQKLLKFLVLSFLTGGAGGLSSSKSAILDGIYLFFNLISI